MVNWADAYARALPYEEFLAHYGTDAHRQRWQAAYERAAVTPAQREMLASFARQMHLLCVAGTWCGDCVREGAILQRIAESAPQLQLRFLDRDENREIAGALAINDGLRIPIVVFLSEDLIECARYGERTLATYRKMAQERLGARPVGESRSALPAGESRAAGTLVIGNAPATPEEHYASVIQDWMNEIERVQLLLRLSPRLRAKHED